MGKDAVMMSYYEQQCRHNRRCETQAGSAGGVMRLETGGARSALACCAGRAMRAALAARAAERRRLARRGDSDLRGKSSGCLRCGKRRCRKGLSRRSCDERRHSDGVRCQL